MLKHLRSASRRLAVVRLSDVQRRQLALLVLDAQSARRGPASSGDPAADCRRARRSRTVPQNLPERVARKKLIEELLDQVCQRGFLTMGDLRDAISRNNLKLPDLSDPVAISSTATNCCGPTASWPGVGRRLSPRRVLPALDATAEFAGIRHGLGPLPHPLCRRPLRRGLRGVSVHPNVWEWISGAHFPLGTAESSLEAADVGTELHLTSPHRGLGFGLLLCLLNFAAFRRGVGTVC